MDSLNYITPNSDDEPSIIDHVRPLLTISDGIPYFKDNFFEKRWYKFGWRGALILLILAGAYVPALIGNVLWIDETENTHEQYLRSSAGLAKLWIHPSVQSAYQPVADSVLWLEHYLWPKTSVGFHIVGILLHMANCMLVWFVLRRLNVKAAWLAAAIFAMHPVQVQAVAWVGGQPILMGTMFYITSLILFLRFAQIEPTQELDPTVKLSDEWYNTHPDEPAVAVTIGAMPRACYAFSLAMFLCAILSDSAAWSLPLIIFMILRWRGGEITRKDIKALIPYFAIGGLSFIFSLIQSELFAYRAQIATNLSFVGRLLLPGRVLVHYLLSLIVPFPLTFAGPQWTVSALTWWQYLFLLALIGGLGALWHFRHRLIWGPMIAIVFFLLNLLPVLGLVRFGWMRYSFVGDYLQYRACIGPIALGLSGLMYLLTKIKSKDVERLIQIACAIAIIAPFSALAVWQTTNYASAETLWLADLDTDPHSEVDRLQLAAEYIRQDKAILAINQIELALKDNPDKSSLWDALGNAYAADKNWGGAGESYRKAVSLDPRNVEALGHVAQVDARQGRIGDAIKEYLDALTIDPNNARNQASVAEMYLLVAHSVSKKDMDEHPDARAYYQKNLAKAIIHLEAAVKLDPNSTPHHLNLAKAYFENKQYKESAEQLQIAAKNDPNNFDVFMTAGDLLTFLGDFARAERMYRDATRINPKSFEAFNNLGVALANEKPPRLEEAEYAINQALKLNPNFAPAIKNLQAVRWAEAHPEALQPQQPAPAANPTEIPSAPTLYSPPAPTQTPANKPATSTAPAPKSAPATRPATKPKPTTRPAAARTATTRPASN